MSTAPDKYESFTGFTPLSTLGPHRAADYWKLPEGAPYELIRGRLTMSPSPTRLHQMISGLIYELLRDGARTTDASVVYAPMDVVLSHDTILQPDLLYISKQRDHIFINHVEGAPDLVVEILSPGTDRRDRTEKLDLYAKYEVPEFWLVDPNPQLFQFLLLKNGEYTIQQQPDNHYRSPRLPEIAIDLAAFWAEIERRMPKA